MKLNKKRITILVSLMCLLVLLVFTLCSFSLPNFNVSPTTISAASSSDVDLLMSLANIQKYVGSFNSLEPIFAYHVVNNPNVITLVLISTPYEYSWSGSNDSPTSFFNFQSNSSTQFYFINFTPTGFTFIQPDNRNGQASFMSRTCLFYRPSLDSGFIKNPNYNYGSTNNSAVSSAYLYWDSYLSNLSVDADDVESAAESAYVDGYGDGYSEGFDTGFDSGYFDGLESGLVWGEELGYQEGYTEGYQEGIGTGYRDGFLAGEAEGYDTGYADGYQDGYDTGYSDGLEDAPPETVTIVIYEEPVEIDVPGIISSISSIPDSVLSGSFDFEFAGINIYGLLKLLIIVFIISAVIFFIIKRSA